MIWIKIGSRNELPRDGSIFLAIWKGRICLVQHDVEEDRFYIVFEPASYSQSWKLDQEREAKFTFWMPLPPRHDAK